MKILKSLAMNTFILGALAFSFTSLMNMAGDVNDRLEVGVEINQASQIIVQSAKNQASNL